MKIFQGGYILPFNITISKRDQFKKDDLNYNFQSLNSTSEKICMGNGRLFYFKDAGKLDLYYILKRRYPVKKKIIHQ